MHRTIVTAYDATPAGADGLALACWLTDVLEGRRVAARVFLDSPSSESTDRVDSDLTNVRHPAAAKLVGRWGWWPTVPPGVRPMAPRSVPPIPSGGAS